MQRWQIETGLFAADPDLEPAAPAHHSEPECQAAVLPLTALTALAVLAVLHTLYILHGLNLSERKLKPSQHLTVTERPAVAGGGL